MFKKIIKILIILLIIILVIIVGDYIYLEVRISMEKARIEAEKRNEFIIDDDKKIEVVCEHNIADAWQTDTYCINLETNIVEKKISSGNCMPLWGNELLIWNKKRLELKDLKMTEYNRIANTKILSNEEKQELEKLINRVIYDRGTDEIVEDNTKITGSIFYRMNLSRTHRITTKDKKDVLMDNMEDKKLFLKLVE